MNDTILFTSDTHFGQERTLELSRRPFSSVKEMDTVMLENINKMISDTGAKTLYHLGDFGDHEYVKLINCDVILIYGNYEYKEMVKMNITSPIQYNMMIMKRYGYLKSAPGMILNLENVTGRRLILAHEPIKAYKSLMYFLKENEKECKTHCDFALFGHIHGRQKIKDFGIDVGVDANNYKPMTLDDVEFYLNAIEKGYYDEEVFFNAPIQNKKDE